MARPVGEETRGPATLDDALDRVDRAALSRALDAWARDPSRPIADFLEAEGIADPGDQARIERAVRRELDRLGDSPTPELATIAAFASIAGLPGRNAEPGQPAPPPEEGGTDAFETIVDFAPAAASVAPAPIGPADEEDDDPNATRVSPLLPFGPASGPLGSDINPIPSALGRRGDFPSGGGPVPTPDLSPPSSLDLPGVGPSSGSGGGSGLPRFNPDATDDVEVRDPSSSAGPATLDADGLAATEADPFATAMGDAAGPALTVTQGVGLDETMAGPAGSEPSIAASFFAPGSSSRFRVVRAHAKGGLGSVLVAFDQELRREVALKEIQERHADNPDSRARFLLEAEITGGLEHPGVVPVYSLGKNADGRPYYAMRFIRGDSLRKAIERFHDPERGPKEPGERSLALRAMLRRFVDVCNAMEYAHSRGVIHRDIKPDNIMLGPYGETLLVDWGLAKAVGGDEIRSQTEELPLRPLSTAGSTPTLDGSAIGTPAFMSPEQAEGDLARMGPPADVYSLGATLYQILTGVPAFQDRNLYQVLLKVREGDFPGPREVKPEIPPALEAICLTAMATAIEDRYPSCRALSDDLEHWLADEPVSVYREPWTVRFGRWAKRHRTLVTSAAVLLVTAVVGLSVGAFLLEQERSRTEEARQDAVAGWEEARENEAEAVAQRNRAEQNAEEARRNAALAESERDRADAQRLVAERNFQSATDAVDALLTEVGEIDLADVPQMEQTRRDLLEKARAFYERFLAENDGPETRRAAGRARSRLGDIHELLGAYAESRAAYDAAVAVQQPMAEADPDDAGLAADLARTRHNLGVLLKKLNEFEPAIALLDQARAARAALADRSPDDLDARSDLAASLYQLGAVRARLVGQRAAALDLYRQAIDLQRSVVAGRGDRPEDRRELARYLNNLALLLQGTDPEAAGAAFDESIRLQRQLVAEHSEVPHFARELARTLNNRVARSIAEEPEAAEEALRESIALAERLTTDFPKVPDYWSELGGYLSNLGQLLLERGRAKDDQDAAREAEALFSQAEAAYRRSESIRTGLVEQYPDRPEYRQRLALIRQSIASFLRRRDPDRRAEGQGRAEGLVLIDSAIALLRGLVEASPEVPEYRKDLALALDELAYWPAEGTEAGPDSDHAEKEADVERLREARSLAKEAARDRPNDAVYWGTVIALEKRACRLVFELGRFDESLELARSVGDGARGDGAHLAFAAVQTLRAAKARKDQPDSPPGRFEAERDAASSYLRLAAEAGFHARNDAGIAEFEPFRELPGVGEAIDAIKGSAAVAR